MIGGGLPVGAYGGREDIMQMVAPAGPMYQAGTLSGNPLAVQAGIVTLKALKEPGLWDAIARQTRIVADGWKTLALEHSVPLQVAVAGSMFGCFFTDRPVTDWDSAKLANSDRFAEVFHQLLQRGVYLAPSQFEACFMSSAHGDAEVAHTLEAVDAALSLVGA